MRLSRRVIITCVIDYLVNRVVGCYSFIRRFTDNRERPACRAPPRRGRTPGAKGSRQTPPVRPLGEKVHGYNRMLDNKAVGEMTSLSDILNNDTEVEWRDILVHSKL